MRCPFDTKNAPLLVIQSIAKYIKIYSKTYIAPKYELLEVVKEQYFHWFFTICKKDCITKSGHLKKLSFEKVVLKKLSSAEVNLY